MQQMIMDLDDEQQRSSVLCSSASDSDEVSEYAQCNTLEDEDYGSDDKRT